MKTLINFLNRLYNRINPIQLGTILDTDKTNYMHVPYVNSYFTLTKRQIEVVTFGNKNKIN